MRLDIHHTSLKAAIDAIFDVARVVTLGKFLT